MIRLIIKKKSRIYTICILIFSGLVVGLRVLLKIIPTIYNIQPMLLLIDGLIFVFMIATWIFAGLLYREKSRAKNAEESRTEGGSLF